MNGKMTWYHWNIHGTLQWLLIFILAKCVVLKVTFSWKLKSANFDCLDYFTILLGSVGLLDMPRNIQHDKTVIVHILKTKTTNSLWQFECYTVKLDFKVLKVFYRLVDNSLIQTTGNDFPIHKSSNYIEFSWNINPICSL